jgi:hypothetical protein
MPDTETLLSRCTKPSIGEETKSHFVTIIFSVHLLPILTVPSIGDEVKSHFVKVSPRLLYMNYAIYRLGDKK